MCKVRHDRSELDDDQVKEPRVCRAAKQRLAESEKTWWCKICREDRPRGDFPEDQHGARHKVCGRHTRTVGIEEEDQRVLKRTRREARTPRPQKKQKEKGNKKGVALALKRAGASAS